MISWGYANRRDIQGNICLTVPSSSGFTWRSGWVTLRYMKVELGSKPRNIVDRGHDAAVCLGAFVRHKENTSLRREYRSRHISFAALAPGAYLDCSLLHTVPSYPPGTTFFPLLQITERRPLIRLKTRTINATTNNPRINLVRRSPGLMCNLAR